MDKDLADQVVDIARRVVASGAISANGHGNVRVPGAAEIYFTAGPSLRDHPASAVAAQRHDGPRLTAAGDRGTAPRILEGQGSYLPPSSPQTADV